ncbi:MAG TPA: PQQ-binding-like beta-propeller repeat protein, partial [Candidatus Acidoferrales bacterium]|nr:PQQ-binding-like beta-propeller repeat protein [Candidatus Acidoferrales bacterium]
VNVGGNITSSPSLPRGSDFLFVGTDDSRLLALNPTTLATLATFTVSPADGPVKGFPVLASKASPFTIVFSTNGNVSEVTYSGGVTFTSVWKTPITAPSTPITSTDVAAVYVGGGDGKIHELNLGTGVDQKQRLVDAGTTVGDPSLDLFQSCGGSNCVIAGSTDGRVYAFTFPF